MQMSIQLSEVGMDNCWCGCTTEEEKEGAVAVASEHHVHAPQNESQQPARNTEKTESTNDNVHQEESRWDHSHHQGRRDFVMKMGT